MNEYQQTAILAATILVYWYVLVTFFKKDGPIISSLKAWGISWGFGIALIGVALWFA